MLEGRLIQGHCDVPLGSDPWSFHHRDSRDGPSHLRTDTPSLLTPPQGTSPFADVRGGSVFVVRFFLGVR
jgi:hypothetical protein